jgi:hypothetical protein
MLTVVHQSYDIQETFVVHGGYFPEKSREC